MNHLVLRSCHRIVKARAAASKLIVPYAPARFFSVSGVYLNNNPSNTNNDHDFRHSEELAKERYDIRAGEDIEGKRARLIYQSRKRGMLENGVILASFADKYLYQFNADQLDDYDRLINLPTNDWDIFYWATKTKPTPPEFETPVMQKLREHLKSKVSKEQQNDTHGNDYNKEDGKEDANRFKSLEDAVMGKYKPEDVVLPPVKTHYELEIDPMEEDLTNFRENLIDNRIKKFKSGASMQLMTDWRKQQLEARLRRGISSPISSRNLSENKVAKVFTQRSPRRAISIRKPFPRNVNLIDKTSERKLKHHNFMQYMFGHQFTKDVIEYESEAKAWAEMLWHRDYGTLDMDLAPSTIKCSTCLSNLHCCDPGLDGYIPKELFLQLTVLPNDGRTHKPQSKCQKCKFYDTYQVNLSAEVSPLAYENILTDIANRPESIICLLLDLTDFPGCVWPDLLNKVGIPPNQLIVVGNKLDLLPYDGPGFFTRVETSIRENLSLINSRSSHLRISDVVLLSARTGFGVQTLITRLAERWESSNRDIYLVGSTNSGKSTLLNALLQSDLCTVREGDILSRTAIHNFQSSREKYLKFPITQFVGWDVMNRSQRTFNIWRKTFSLTKNFDSSTRRLRRSMPHMKLISNRLNYEPLPIERQTNNETQSSLVNIKEIEDTSNDIKFAKDHPIASVETKYPFSAQGDNFPGFNYFHYTPSVTTHNQIHSLLTNDEKLDVYNYETLSPRKYNLRPLDTLFIAGLARLDLLTATSYVTLLVFASCHLPIHVIPTRKADQFYATFLGSPYLGVPNFGGRLIENNQNDELDESMRKRRETWPKMLPSERNIFVKGGPKPLGGVLDIVFSSIGWALVEQTQDHECLIKPYSPGAKGLFVRTPPLVPLAREIVGKKLRDTPGFEHPHYKIEQMPA